MFALLLWFWLKVFEILFWYKWAECECVAVECYGGFFGAELSEDECLVGVYYVFERDVVVRVDSECEDWVFELFVVFV